LELFNPAAWVTATGSTTDRVAKVETSKAITTKILSPFGRRLKKPPARFGWGKIKPVQLLWAVLLYFTVPAVLSSVYQALWKVEQSKNASR
jgi:hypothetical protein